MNVLITGATGLLGSNFLNEIIKVHGKSLHSLKLTLLGRDKKELPFSKRIIDQVLEEEQGYFDNLITRAELLDFLQNSVQYISYNLESDYSETVLQKHSYLKTTYFDHVFHIAALTDFRNNRSVVEKLIKTNVDGTRYLLSLVKQMSIKQFNFIGSAYSCGKTYGEIAPDYINLNQEFRNPYEKTKLEAEILVRKFSEETGIRCKYFRPSTIGGRVMEKPFGKVNKFDVFYSLGTFLLREKRKNILADSLYEEKWNCSLRLQFNPKSGLNIVPADYAAKAILKIALSNIEDESFHIASEQEYPHNRFITEIVEICNIEGVEPAESIPHDKNSIEKFYYKTVGNIFKDYLGQPEIKFCLSNISTLYDNEHFGDYQITDENFRTMLSFAKPRAFGLA